MKEYFDLFYSEAENYNKAAEVLIRSKYKTVDNQLFLTQRIFLRRHACELLLKAIIIDLFQENSDVSMVGNIKLVQRNGVELKRSIFETHSLLELVDTIFGYSSLNLLLLCSGNILQSLRERAIEIDDVDPDSCYFRYPCNNDGKMNVRAYYINVDNPNICPDFNNYSIDDICINDEGQVNYIRVFPEAEKLEKKIIKFWIKLQNFLKIL